MQYKWFVFKHDERVAHSEADTEKEAICNFFNKKKTLKKISKLDLKAFEQLKKEGYKTAYCKGGWEIIAIPIDENVNPQF